MVLNLQSFRGWVTRQASAVRASSASLLDLTSGSILRAILEANASVALWMQWLILLVLQTTRAATSNGSDLDTWVADFAVTRLATVPATVAVTFSRLTTGQSALILPGVQVKTVDGTQIFTVTTDTTNAAWNATLGGYFLAASGVSLSLPTQAATAGVAGNVLAGTVALLSTAISGIDGVTNTLAATGGMDAESDTALRRRFVAYINSRARGTLAAVGYAVVAVRQGLTYAIAENSPSIGRFAVYVDDGSGAPAASLLASVYTAIDAVRPLGSIFAVYAPSVVAVSIAVSVTPKTGISQAYVDAAAGTALTAYIATLGMGQGLSYLRLSQIALDADAGIADVTALTINSATASITATAGQVIRLSSLSAT